jgi:hypothetical protein
MLFCHDLYMPYHLMIANDKHHKTMEKPPSTVSDELPPRNDFTIY